MLAPGLLELMPNPPPFTLRVLELIEIAKVGI